MTGTDQTPTTQASADDQAPPFRYTARLANEIELGWQRYWDEHGTFNTPNPTGDLSAGFEAIGGAAAEKAYILDMFPYPSGAGLHVGHPLGYIGTDVLGRYLRMTGKNVLHTVGYDAFGLPAEQYAIRTGTHPRETTEANVAHYRQQLRRLGFAHDPRRSVATTDTDFFRWTQWIFLKVFNSWFDPDADGGRGKARPISELEAEFAAGRAIWDGPAAIAAKKLDLGDREWAELTRREQQLVLAEYRLAYIAEAPVNWCPGLGTVLSNEEVTAEGTSEIGNFPVYRRNLRQWMMRITAYADRLVADLDRLDWPESIKSMQRNWIGRSTGAEVLFGLEPRPEELAAAGGKPVPTALIAVYTTRPDTLFGATYMVLAPEHELVDYLVEGVTWPEGTNPLWTGGAQAPKEAVAEYRAQAARKSDLDRQDTKNKTGVFTGRYAVNPVNNRRIPIFIADYVLMGYGTGAIMAVPAQDTRDWDFAKAFGLPYLRTVQPPADHDEDAPYTGDGPAINSANDDISLDGMDVAAAKECVVRYLNSRGMAHATTQYKLRDWLFSRQRYWGEPFPIVYRTDPDEDDYPIALPDHYLPLELPEVEDYKPQAFDPHDADSTPVPPLNRATDWKTVILDLGDGPRQYRRELNVMPQWAGSCWYELRYLDPTNSEAFCDPAVEKYWMGKKPGDPRDPGGVDLYVGGVEHAVLHLLYSRFWHKVLYDLGHVSSEEPFRRLYNQGYIQAYAYTDERGVYVPAEEVTEPQPGVYVYDGKPVHREYGKMGKSLRNVVTPDSMCEAYGADTFRMYEMAMGPLDVSRPWQTKDAVGAQRYLQRLWRLVVDEETGDTIVSDEPTDDDTRALLHRTIDGVRSDFEGMLYNTAISKLIVLVNHVTKEVVGTGGRVPREVAEPLTLMTAPLAPHIAEELWKRLGHGASLARGPFPTADPALLTIESVEYPVQVKGKVRSHITVAADADAAQIQAAALADEKIAEILAGVAPRKVVVVPGRMVSIVP